MKKLNWTRPADGDWVPEWIVCGVVVLVGCAGLITVLCIELGKIM